MPRASSMGVAVLRALLAVVLLLAMAAPFGTSVEPRPFDLALGRPVPAAGSALRMRTEGWATTHYADHGLLAVDVEAADRRGGAARILGVWGDSFVEASQVDDATKFTAQLRRLALEHGDSTLTAYAIGQPDRDVTDVVDLVPRYQRLIHFEHHVLVLHDLFDVSPNHATFLATPTPHFVARRFEAPAPRLRAKLSAFRLDFLWPSLYRLVFAHRNPIGGQPLRLRPGPVDTETTTWPDWQELSKVDPRAWAYALERLQGSSSTDWTIFYLPRVPMVERGEVRLEHPAAEFVRVFAALCYQQNIEFVDLSDALADEYRQHGHSAFGFANARVGRGHLNAAGHRILAQALFDRFGAR